MEHAVDGVVWCTGGWVQGGYTGVLGLGGYREGYTGVLPSHAARGGLRYSEAGPGSPAGAGVGGI